MPVGDLPVLVLVLAGAVTAAAGVVLLRLSGAEIGIGRRLGAAREVPVGDLVDAADLPTRPIRVVGRVRCADPLHTADGERLVAFQRDVEVRLPTGHWRSIERLRETRSFELWDHGGSLAIDPAEARDPLIVIPHVWRGGTGELQEPHRSAVARLTARGGAPREARSTSRQLSVTDRILVLARADRGPDGHVILRPPAGGYLISALAIPDTMRLLGGAHRRLLGAGIAAVGLGILLVAAALIVGLGRLLFS